MAQILKHPLFAKIRYYLLLLAIGSLPFSIRSNRLSIIALVIFSFLVVDLEMLKKNLITRKGIFLPCLILLLNVFGLIFSEDLTSGLALVERTAVLLIIPLIFLSFSPFTDTGIHKIIEFFAYVCSLTAMYCVLYAFWSVFQSGSLIDQAQVTDREYYFFINKELTVSAIDISPIYFGLYINLCIAFLIYRIFFLGKYNRWDASLLIFLNCFQILLISLNALVTLAVLWAMVFFRHFRHSKAARGRRATYIVALCTLVLTSLIYFVRPLHDRVFVDVNYDIQKAHVSYWNGITLRLAVLECAWESAINSPLWGYGTGDADNELMRKYVSRKFALGEMLGLNAHNQYIQSYLMHGILGLSVLLIVILVPFYCAVKTRNWLLIFLQIIVGLAFFTEVILSTQKGIVFYTLFFSLLYLPMDNEKNLDNHGSL